MSNVEEVTLHLVVDCGDQYFIDGNDLQKNITNYMPRLNKFLFHIRSMIYFRNNIYSPSNTDIQHTFTNFKDNQIISSVDYFRTDKAGRCHIHT
jgi:hypothetical protein